MSEKRWPLGRRIEIEWDDTTGSHGWSPADEYCSLGPLKCRTIGYVLTETDTHLTVVQNMSAGNGHVADSMTIPKRIIRHRWVLGATGSRSRAGLVKSLRKR